MNRDSSPFRYLPVHLLEVARGRLIFFAVVAIALVMIIPDSLGNGAGNVLNGQGILVTLVQTSLLVAVLIASGEVAGNDIRNGYYRTWFSKPIAPWWYYLERWLLGGIAVLLIPLLLALGFVIAGWPVRGLSGTLFGGVALGYLLIGGMALLLSTVTRRDWLVVFLVAVMEARLHDIHRFLDADKLVPRAINMLITILPPFHLINDAIAGKATGSEILHLAAYGVGLVVAALLIFKYRPMGSGGRA